MSKSIKSHRENHQDHYKILSNKNSDDKRYFSSKNSSNITNLSIHTKNKVSHEISKPFYINSDANRTNQSMENTNISTLQLNTEYMNDDSSKLNKSTIDTEKECNYTTSIFDNNTTALNNTNTTNLNNTNGTVMNNTDDSDSINSKIQKTCEDVGYIAGVVLAAVGALVLTPEPILTKVVAAVIVVVAVVAVIAFAASIFWTWW